LALLAAVRETDDLFRLIDTPAATDKPARLR